MDLVVVPCACCGTETKLGLYQADTPGAKLCSACGTYENEPIRGGNPYWRCKACKRSDPEINGRLEGHLDWCSWRKAREEQIRRAQHNPNT